MLVVPTRRQWMMGLMALIGFTALVFGIIYFLREAGMECFYEKELSNTLSNPEIRYYDASHIEELLYSLNGTAYGLGALAILILAGYALIVFAIYSH